VSPVRAPTDLRRGRLFTNVIVSVVGTVGAARSRPAPVCRRTVPSAAEAKGDLAEDRQIQVGAGAADGLVRGVARRARTLG
jgi:hypothetical protein